jgi:uncharacterized protein YxjI
MPRSPQTTTSADATSEEDPMLGQRRAQRAAPAGNVFQMKQQMFSIGDDFWIENSAGQRAYKVDGKALRVRKTLVLESPDGRELYKVQEKLAHIRDTMDIEGPTGRVATIKKALVAPLRERYDVAFDRGGGWKVQGNIVDHEYRIEGDAGPVAEVGKKWFRVRDTYGVEITPGQDDAMVLMVAIAIDSMSHPAR